MRSNLLREVRKDPGIAVGRTGSRRLGSPGRGDTLQVLAKRPRSVFWNRECLPLVAISLAMAA
jgi:hypothetical protein